MWNKRKIELTLFISGAVGMILEIVGSRLLAPFFGNSIFVWTSLIGVILGSLSLGYFLGGKLADKKLSVDIFFWLLFSAGASIFVLFLLDIFLIPVLPLRNLEKLFSVLVSLLLFSPASIILGAISPYGIRLKLKNIKESGSIIGTLYAISTMGSIVGTFTAGFVLISLLGTRSIILLLAILMALASLINVKAMSRKVVFPLLLIFCAVISIFLLKIIITNEFDTAYDRYFIVDYKDNKSQSLRALTRNRHTIESAIYLDNQNITPIEYIKFYDLYSYFKPETKKSLMIGGGMFTYPRQYVETNKNGSIDVIEIDPQLLSLAKAFFGYHENDRITNYFQDGRLFLNNSNNKYDAIFMDAFKSDTSIPYQLTTKEAITKCYNSTEQGGVFIGNIVGSLAGSRSKFLLSEYKTINSIYDQTFLFAVNNETNKFLVQNFIIVGVKGHKEYDFKSDNSRLQALLDQRLDISSSLFEKSIILSDDYNPAEQYVAGI